MNVLSADAKTRPTAVQPTDEPAPETIWREPVALLLQRLTTTPAGLDAAEASSRLATYGPNDAATVKRVPLWLQFIARFRNPLVIILLVASGLSALTGDVASFFIVIAIVTMSMTLDFVQEVRAQNAVEALRRSVAVQASVRRDGATVSLPIDRLVPGDVVELIAGDLVPADSPPARKPRSVRQSGPADRGALSGRETCRRRRVRRGKSSRRLKRRVRRNFGDQRHGDDPGLPHRRADRTGPSRDQPGGEAAGHRFRDRHPPVRHADHAISPSDGAVRAGGEHLLPPAIAGIADVRAGARRRADARIAADDRDGHAGSLGDGNGETQSHREALVGDP